MRVNKLAPKNMTKKKRSEVTDPGVLFHFHYHSCGLSRCFLATGGASCVVSLLSLWTSLRVGVANDVSGGNSVVTEEEGGRGEVVKVWEDGEGGRWLAVPIPTHVKI